MGEEERVNSLWNYLLRNREPFSSPNKALFQFISSSNEGESIFPFQVMAFNPTFDVFEQLHNVSNVYIFTGVQHTACLGEAAALPGGGVKGASSCGLQAGAQLSAVVCNMSKEPLENMILTTPVKPVLV